MNVNSASLNFINNHIASTPYYYCNNKENICRPPINTNTSGS